MPSPYSYDFRQKAIEAYQRGERKKDICSLLKISRNTLDLWLKRKAQTGDFKAKTDYLKGRKPKIDDLDRLREFVKKHGDKTQKEMARLWGEKVTQQNISDALKKLSITRKSGETPRRRKTQGNARQDKNLWISGEGRTRTTRISQKAGADRG